MIDLKKLSFSFLLLGSINLPQWQQCVATISHACHQSSASRPSIPLFMQCYEPLMKKTEICQQNLKLFNAANIADIREMRLYHKIQVIKADVLMADLSTRFFMVTPEGELVQLVAISQKELKANNHRYIALLQQYPQLSLWDLTDDFPREEIKNGIIRLIFRQTLKDGCMACASPGTAELAYDFDQQGHYLGYELI